MFMQIPRAVQVRFVLKGDIHRQLDGGNVVLLSNLGEAEAEALIVVCFGTLKILQLVVQRCSDLLPCH